MTLTCPIGPPPTPQGEWQSKFWSWITKTWFPLSATKEYVDTLVGNSGRWRFDGTSIVMADPGSGKIRADNATVASITQLAISVLTDFDVDATLFFQLLRAADKVIIQDRDDATKWMRFTMTGAPTNNTTWFLFPVTYVASLGTAPTNNDTLLVIIT